MGEQKSSKKALKIVFSLLLTAGVIVSLLPFGAAASWRKVFSFFGLSDFSCAADKSPLSVHVLNVGKADSIFIESSGKYMLIDGGTFDRGEAVAEYLERRGVKQLDYVVSTHPDDDHIGGLKEVVSRFAVKHYLAPKIPSSLIPSTQEYRAVQAVLTQKNIMPVTPTRGESFVLGGAKIQVLAPVKTGDSTNNNSIVLRLSYGKTSFLLMGDAEKDEENDLLATGADLSATVLKVGHHGSDGSSSIAFLNAVKPQYAAISVADDTSHLPKQVILKRLDSVGARIYRTDVSGTLLFLSDGKEVTVVTEKGK